jgi:hypothetical protein
MAALAAKDEGSPLAGTGVVEDEVTMSTDTRGTKILARTFFNQLRTGGYTPNQIIGIATELIDLVTVDLKHENTAATEPRVGDEAAKQELRHSA